MSSWAPELETITAVAPNVEQSERTHVRVQVIPLCITAAASAAFVAATNLPWFGALGGSNPTPQYSAVSGMLVAPGSPAGLVPGTQNWGHLLVAWSALLTVLAVVAIGVSATSGHRNRRGTLRVLASVGIASLVLVALVVPELTAQVQYDMDSFVGFGWGALVGLGLALVASFGAWFAWATLRFPLLWGVASSAD